ncbi:uncharacterized protein LOC119727538 isoform X2 [Patiria miniata]|nr:uncharacterized protein LOC119727538 isoform X2 [Patiria miniata]
MSSPALRRARFDILYQDCENEIKRLQQENENLKNSNSQLQEQLADTKKYLASRSEKASNSTGAAPVSSPNSKTKVWRDSSLPSPRSSPSASKLKGKGKWDEPTSLSPGMKRDRHGRPSSSSQQDWINGLESSSREDGSDNGEVLSALRSKLKQATLTYEKIKQDMDKLKEKNIKLSTDNRALLTENGRLKQAAATRSPRKYEKYTSMAQQSKLDSCRREVSQLKSALERSDTYIEELETELGNYKSLFGSLPRKRPCHGKESTARTLTTSTGRAQSAASEPSETDLTFRSMDNSLDDTSKFVPPASSGGCLTYPRPLADEDVGTSSSGSRLLPFDGIRVHNSDRYRFTSTKKSASANSHSGRLSKDGRKSLSGNKEASRVLVRPKPGSGAVGEGSRKNDKELLGSDDDSDLDEPSPVRSTPSTAMGKLTLDSANRSLRPSAPDESLESKFKISPSCHRQLDFGQDSPEIAALQFSLEKADTHGLLLEGNMVDVGPLDQNVTFSDLDFTLTSEISDCAKLMKEAEKRVKQKRLSHQEGEAGCSNAVTKTNIKGFKGFKSFVPSKNSDLINKDTCYFAPITPALNKGNSDQPTGTAYCKSLHLKSQDMKMDFDSGNTRVTWSKNHPDYRITQRSTSSKPQEADTYMSGAAPLSADGVGQASQLGSYSRHSSMSSNAASRSILLPPRGTRRPVLPESSTIAASEESSSLVNRFEPTIRPQLMRLRHNTDPSGSKAGKSRLKESNRLRSDGDNDWGTFDSVNDDVGARVGSVVGRPGRRGNPLLAASESETKAFFFFQGLDNGGGDTGKDNHKRIRLEQDSDDDDDDYTMSKSPTF